MYQTLRFDTSTLFLYINEVIAERGGDGGVNVGDVSEINVGDVSESNYLSVS